MNTKLPPIDPYYIRANLPWMELVKAAEEMWKQVEEMRRTTPARPEHLEGETKCSK